MTSYNKTQLNPNITFQKHVYHRDQFAHYLRWTHVLKLAKIGMKILDFGCGSANLLEVFYRNRYKPELYVGIDIRKQTINKMREKYLNLSYANFIIADLVNDIIKIKNVEFDMICSFEVIEHIGKNNINNFLQNIKNNMIKNKTILLLSTPIYDNNVGAAKNHIINGKIGELTYDEMKEFFIQNNFIIKNTYGTFASQKDYKSIMNDWQIKFFDYVSEYFDSNILSNIMAPMFPEYSRNCLWKVIYEG